MGAGWVAGVAPAGAADVLPAAPVASAASAACPRAGMVSASTRARVAEHNADRKSRVVELCTAGPFTRARRNVDHHQNNSFSPVFPKLISSLVGCVRQPHRTA